MKRIRALALMIATAMLSLTACSDKDTAVIVNVQDSGNDSSQNEVVDNTNGKAEVKQETDSNSDNTVAKEQEQKEEEPDITLSIKGKWIGSDDNTYTFKDNSEFYGYNSQTETDLIGTYETDESTYLKITITKENGVETNKTLEYSISPITETTDIDEDREVRFSLTSGETVIELRKASELKTLDSDEDEDSKVEVTELTGQELEDVRQELINMGINPDTGLTFEEEATMLALTPAAEQPQTEAGVEAQVIQP